MSQDKHDTAVPPDWQTIAQLIDVLKEVGGNADIDGQDVDGYIVQLLSTAEHLRSCLSEPSHVVASILSICDGNIDLVIVVRTVVERCVLWLMLGVCISPENCV